MKRSSSIDSVLKPLAKAPLQGYICNILQLADILEWILSQVGRSRVYQTSFSISDEFLRRLHVIEKSGNIADFTLILDNKATSKTLKLWVFISKVIQETYLADNHSKVLLVESEAGDKVTVITSQNLTRGNRMESGIISTDPDMFDTMKTAFMDIVKYHSIPFSEIMEHTLFENTENDGIHRRSDSQG